MRTVLVVLAAIVMSAAAPALSSDITDPTCNVAVLSGRSDNQIITPNDVAQAALLARGYHPYEVAVADSENVQGLNIEWSFHQKDQKVQITVRLKRMVQAANVLMASDGNTYSDFRVAFQALPRCRIQP